MKLEYVLVFLLIIVTALAGVLAQRIMSGYVEHTVHPDSFEYIQENNTLIYAENGTLHIIHDIHNITYQDGEVTYTVEKMGPVDSKIFYIPTFMTAVGAFFYFAGRDLK